MAKDDRKEKVSNDEGLIEKLVQVNRVAKVVKVAYLRFHRSDCCWRR